MKIAPQSVLCCGDAVRVQGPQGDVLLSKDGDDIICRYIGDQLLNGSALVYAEKIRKAALEFTKKHPFPWYKDKEGTIHILNHKDYYAQSFQPSLAGIERLQLWKTEPL
jgi:hypothetical protein